MEAIVKELWPEIEWIEDRGLRSKVANTWALALRRSSLKPEDLTRIPFTLLIHGKVPSFMEHKRCVVHIARCGGEAIAKFLGESVKVDMDTILAGAILADVGKLLEYEVDSSGNLRQCAEGELLRHPFTGVALAVECGVPVAICHTIAAHAAEGQFVRRTAEAWIIHHADFMAFDLFKSAQPPR